MDVECDTEYPNLASNLYLFKWWQTQEHEYRVYLHQHTILHCSYDCICQPCWII